MESFIGLYPVITLMEAILLAGIGFGLLWMKIPAREELNNYRMAKRILALSYLLLAAVNVAALLADNDLSHLQRDLNATLVAAIFHLLLFTYAIVALIYPRLVTTERVVLEALPVALFLVWIIWANLTEHKAVERWVFLLFGGYYVLTLVRCIRLYFREEAGYKERADNYFSDRKERWLMWIRAAFLCELMVSLLAFCSLLDPTTTSRTVFTVICMLNYLFFGLCMMNYVHVFQTIGPVVVDNISLDADTLSTTARDFEKRLAAWVEDKGYLTPGITLGELSEAIHTNPAYLLGYINHRFHLSFRAWIASLRLAEAKRRND